MFKTDTNTPSSELDARIERLQSALLRENIDGGPYLYSRQIFFISAALSSKAICTSRLREPRCFWFARV